MLARAARSYRDVDLTSAPKTQIVERLFARFARDCQDAERALGLRDIPGKTAAIGHATQIAVQLRAALDHGVDAQLSGRLDALYRFVIARLAAANLKLDVAPLHEAVAVMATLSDAFARAHASLAGAVP